MFPVVVQFDLNGTIIAGDEAGGKSPNQSIWTDFLECYWLTSPAEFVNALRIEPLQTLLNTYFGRPIDLDVILKKYEGEFIHNNFLDNFKILLTHCISASQAKHNKSELVKWFLLAESDNAILRIESVLSDAHKVGQIKRSVTEFHQHIDEDHIVTSFYQYVETVQKNPDVHLVLNTFGTEAPKIINKISKFVPVTKEFIIREKTSADKTITASAIHEAVFSGRLVSQQSDFDHYDAKGRVNLAGKLFPIDSSRSGLYVFFDDNLSHESLTSKGCVNIFDVAKSEDVDFTKCSTFTAINESDDIKAILCGKAFVLLVRARLSNTYQHQYFNDIVTKYTDLAQAHYTKNATVASIGTHRNGFYAHKEADKLELTGALQMEKKTQ